MLSETFFFYREGFAMTLKSHSFVTGLLAATLAFAHMPAFSQDASCNAYIEATTPKPDRPYRVQQTIKIDGREMKSEAVYIKNTIYTKSPEMAGGKWMRTPMPDLKETIALAKKTTSRCTVSGVDTLDGKPMKVWTSFATTPFEPKPSQWKTWIGAADGRVYRQASDGFDQRIFYDNVVEPPASEIAQPRKRK
jgi:hypothetical protein